MNRLLIASLMCLTLVITACGGGGGFGEDPNPPEPPGPPEPPIVTDVRAGSGFGINFQENVLGISPDAIEATESAQLEVTLVDESGNLVSSVVTGEAAYNFSSNCLNSGKATLDPNSTIVADGGIVLPIYTPNGCSDGGLGVATPDVITVTVATEFAGTFTFSGTVTVEAPTATSVRYQAPTDDSTAPVFLGLAGTGLLPEQALVQFKVVDEGGNDLVDKDVTFSLIGSSGDTSLTTFEDVSNAQGIVSTTVLAGTVHDNVTVKAVLSATPTISAQSNGVWIGTGLPHQDSFSISTCENIEGGQYDGTSETIKVILSDRFGNPAPANTTVVFQAEGGQVEGACSMDYAFNSGAGDFSFCEVAYTSANPRPTGAEADLVVPQASETRANRATVLAYSVGEESYVDVNGSGTFDDGDGDQWTNLAEVYSDENENGQYDSGERYVDGNSNGVQDSNNDALEGADKFNGVLCEDTVNCSTLSSSSTNISAQVVMIHSESFVGAWASDEIIAGTFDTALGTFLSVTIPDTNGNPMPANSTVTLEVSNGSTFGATEFVYPCTSEPAVFSFIIEPDGATSSGNGQIVVTTPKGNASTINFAIDD
ncbi:MAG: hypothetical protein HOH24_02750 [Chromatiales bacterium]|jgi:hypothetical protein|nr:hypothetical protein [Chromatiales bacterium]